MARKSEKVGRGPCPYCGSRVSFHRTAGSILNFECDADGCGGTGYAHKGEALERKWLASIEGQRAAPVPPVLGDPSNPPLGPQVQAPRKSPSLLIG